MDCRFVFVHDLENPARQLCAEKRKKPRISPEALSYCPVPVQALSLRLLSVDLDGGRLLLRHLLQRDIELAVRVGCIDV